MPIYIHASNNNWADTILQLFMGAVQEFGLPSRVRSDKGGENVDVSWYMLSHPQKRARKREHDNWFVIYIQ